MDRELLNTLLDEAGAVENRDVLQDILRTAIGLAGDRADRLDLKITRDALKEMRNAFRMFAPYEGIPKVTIFGSARTRPEDPLYHQARELARMLAEEGWMVITGAGPGIMAAGIEGAGRARAFGVTIRLPFEEGVTELLAGDEKVVAMKYFFTRKLMLMKESSAFVTLPGGFGTQDETFELFTLLQTGKAMPAPVVLLDVPHGTYWQSWVRFVSDELVGKGLVSPGDTDLFLITDSVDEAVDEVTRFWRNYRSLRWVNETLVVRLAHEPTDDEIATLNEQFHDLCVDGSIEKTGPLPAEVSTRDQLDLHRIALKFDIRRASRLRGLIDGLNRLPSVESGPSPGPPPPQIPPAT